MGLTIHYTGRLKTKDSLPGLIEEVKDIADTYKWKNRTFKKEFPAGSFNKPSFNRFVYGIQFTPPGCETVSLTFLSNGKLISAWTLKYYFEKKETKEIFTGISVKTQYAGVTVHKIIIHLFDYLSKKYFRNFKFYDEAQYWETRDEKLVEETFNKMNALMDSFASALETQPMNTGESFEKYFERLLKQIHKSNTKK